jgi:hypothetical protein
MDVWCVCAFFCVYVVLCLVRGLATNWSPVQGVLPSVKWSRNWETSPMIQSGNKRSKGKYLFCVNVEYTFLCCIDGPTYTIIQHTTGLKYPFMETESLWPFSRKLSLDTFFRKLVKSLHFICLWAIWTYSSVMCWISTAVCSLAGFKAKFWYKVMHM